MLKGPQFLKETLLVLGIGCGGCLTGCGDTGANYVPIVDGTRTEAFTSDLAQCQDVARQKSLTNDETREDALLGAGLGALLAVGAGDPGGAIAAGAVLGGAVGAGAGALERHDERADIVVDCMKARGHKVVG